MFRTLCCFVVVTVGVGFVWFFEAGSFARARVVGIHFVAQSSHELCLPSARSTSVSHHTQARTVLSKCTESGSHS